MRIISVITYVVMVVVNILANYLPINGVTTSYVSNYYANLFAPAGYAFGIWGLIYVLLGLYTLFQIGWINKKSRPMLRGIIRIIEPYFILSSIANTMWIISWHYFSIDASLLLIWCILICMAMIVNGLSKDIFPFCDYVILQLPFRVYFGWITVATIANVATFLVSTGFSGLGISEANWTVLALIIGLIVSGTVILKNRDVAYGLAVLWGYIGIFIKHISPEGFNGHFRRVIDASILCILALVILCGLVLRYQKQFLCKR